jgi:cytochrome c peroxidase
MRIPTLLLCAFAAFAEPTLADGTLPNNFPFLNSSGTAATYSPTGFVDLNHPFHASPGTNGRTCESCHLAQAGWSVRPIDVELLFWLTAGNDPLFNVLDANTPTPPGPTLKAKYAAFSMLRKGLFRRGGNLPATAEFEIVAFDDPLGAGASLTRFEFFRRPLATANFHIAKTIGWHDQNTNGSGDVHEGLINQATGAINNALGGPPATRPQAEDIAIYQEGLRFAQQSVFGLGRLDSCGAQGGPENLSSQPPVNAPFTLYDAWIDLVPGTCTTRAADRKRAQIARGQQLFNANNPGGGSCRGCHNAANNGSNLNGTLFNINTSLAKYRKPGMPLYTLRHKVTGELRQTTDPGRALRTGVWGDLDKFKSPSLRGLAARAPYFHNGIAPTLKDVVVHYEVERGFKFTRQEREDLVAFLEAL